MNPVLRRLLVITVNGQRVGDHILDPPQTAYPSRTLYSSYNVTERLRSGENVIGVLLGRYKYGYMDVWCNISAAGHAETACRSFRMQLVVEMTDGSVVSHVSTSRSTVAEWVGRQGPLIYDHEYLLQGTVKTPLVTDLMCLSFGADTTGSSLTVGWRWRAGMTSRWWTSRTQRNGSQ